MIRVGLIGCGGISKSHRKAYAELYKQGRAKLVCAFDIEPKDFTKSAAININSGNEIIDEDFVFYTDLEKMLANEQIDMVDICLPTYLHCSYAVDMLQRGYHVMCEKPMALNYADCEKMVSAAKTSGKQLMIGQCVRFYPCYQFIKAAIGDGRFGKVIGASFARLSTPPTWGWKNWFMNPELSGGCITDLHIHDVDLVRFLFGEPEAVSCRASSSVCIYDTVHSTFVYGDTPITAIGDWTRKGIPFTQDSSINFEKVTIICNGTKATIYPKDGTEPYSPRLEDVNGYYAELSYFCDVLSGKTENLLNPPESAAITVKTVELLRRSAQNGGKPSDPAL